MIITLYNTSNDEREVTKVLLNSIEVEGYLKAPTSLLYPTITIDTSSFTPKLFEYNYCYISEFSRYYFIDEIISLSTTLYEMRLRVDVLMSYSTAIKNTSAIVNRSASKFNSSISDEKYPLEYNYTYEELNNINYVNEFDLSTVHTYIYRNYVVTFYNPRWNQLIDVDIEPSSNGLDSIYLGNVGALPDNTRFFTLCMNEIDYQKFYGTVSASATLANYIINVSVLPYEPIHGTTIIKEIPFVISESETIYINLINGACFVRGQSVQRFSHAKYTFGNMTSFLEYEPFSKYYIYIPFYGDVQIDVSDVRNSIVYLYYNVNFTTGSATCFLFNSTNNKIIFQAECNLGISIGINSNNFKEVNDSNNIKAITSGINVVSNMIQGISGLALASISGGVGGAVGAVGGITSAKQTSSGVLGIISDVTDYLATKHTNYIKCVTNPSSGTFGSIVVINSFIYKIYRKELNVTSGYFSLIGRKLSEYILLSTLTGYTEIGSVELNNQGFSKATFQEKAMIENALKNGVFL